MELIFSGYTGSTARKRKRMGWMVPSRRDSAVASVASSAAIFMATKTQPSRAYSSKTAAARSVVRNSFSASQLARAAPVSAARTVAS